MSKLNFAPYEQKAAARFIWEAKAIRALQVGLVAFGLYSLATEGSGGLLWLFLARLFGLFRPIPSAALLDKADSIVERDRAAAGSRPARPVLGSIRTPRKIRGAK